MTPSILFKCLLLSASLVTSPAYGEETDLRITEAPSFANAATILRRMSHGVQFRQAAAEAGRSGTDLTLFTVNPADEQWRLVLPDETTDEGRIGLLVWLANDDDGSVPTAVLEAAANNKLAVLSMLDAGADQPLLERRAALALMGTYGFGKQYPIDTSRILVGGSGRSAETAVLLATGYPDIYSGAIAINGTGSIGSKAIPVPLPQLLTIMQQRSDIVFLAEGDESKNAAAAETSFARVCVPGVRVQPVSAGLDASVVDSALRAITTSGSVSVNAECMNKLTASMQADFAAVDAKIAEERWAEASDALLDAHMKYGGLADGQVMERWDRINLESNELMMRAAEHMAASILKRFNRPTVAPSPRSGNQ